MLIWLDTFMPSLSSLPLALEVSEVKAQTVGKVLIHVRTHTSWGSSLIQVRERH